jgi:hypothetical protein
VVLQADCHSWTAVRCFRMSSLSSIVYDRRRNDVGDVWEGDEVSVRDEVLI